MKTPSLLIFALAASVVAGSGAPPSSPSDREAARKAALRAKKTEFAGGDASWLPRVKGLPTAQDISATAEKLSSRTRALDPFSVMTYPREVEQKVEEETNRPTIRLTLNQALQTLKLNGVNITQKEFLIGGRNVCEGDVIELSYRNENFQALCVEINATEIVFRDLQRGDVGIMPHNMIPKLQLEPMRKVASSLEARWTPMEPATPPQK